MERVSRWSRGLAPLFVIAVLTAGQSSKADDEIVTPANPECTFQAEQVRSPREIWHRLSQRAEAVAPSATTPGRRRATVPPKGDPFIARNFIDNEIFGKMVRDGIQWTSPASDSEFLRRVTIDLTGEIPDSETVKAFLTDSGADKRDRAIDRLLASDAFVDRWTMWLGELVQTVQTATNNNIGLAGRNAYYNFNREAIKNRTPYDQIVRELIAGIGDIAVKGEADYYFRDRQNNGPIQDTYDNLSSSTGERFLGLHLECLSCHGGLAHLELVNTSLAKRTRMDFWQNAAFFAQTQIDRVTTTTPASSAINDNLTGSYRLNTTSGNKTPRQPVNGQSIIDPAFFLTKEGPRSGEPRRVAYGRILTAHPQFARTTVNRLWKEVFGLGIVDPPDSFDLLREETQPTHPALLTELANRFATNGYDLRAILKLMVSSNAYQLSSRYTPGPWNDTWTPYFARHYPHRLMAEAMLDAVVKATNTTISIPVNGLGTVNKAMQLPDTSEGGNFRAFLSAFGRGNRDDQPRSEDSSIVQALLLMNDRIVTDRVRGSLAGSTVAKTLQATRDPGEITDALYLATLSRYPTAVERSAAITYLRSGDLTRKTEDLQFSLLNKLEFLFN